MKNKSFLVDVLLIFVLGCWLLFFESLQPTSNLQKAANWADLIWQQPRKNSLRRK